MKTAKKRASGPTQLEEDRKAKGVFLRLLPATSRKLEALAELWGCTRSEVVATLVVNETGRVARDRRPARDE